MSQERTGIAECPRCHKIWRGIQWGNSGVECNCHLFCSSGTKPSDCTVQYPYNFSGKLGYPTGIHTKPYNEGDNIFQRGGYCATHLKYTNKEPIFLEVDWKRLENTRLPKKLRLMNQ
jgi:hypothetical protein